MTSINCTVENCSYHNQNKCYADKVTVAGQGSTAERQTCCGTFLNEEHYSNLAEHTEYKQPVKEVACNVATCKFNANQLCSLDQINVIGENPATLYVDTDCASFQMK